MDKYERLEELKRKVMVRLSHEEELPKEIEKTIEEIFYGIKEKYDSLQCGSKSIEEYINGNMAYAKGEIHQYLNRERKNNQMEYFQTFFRKIESELDDESRKTDETKRKEEIKQLDFGNKETTIKITDILEKYMKDITLSQNRMLDKRNVSIDEIYNIQSMAHNFINDLINRKSNKFYEALQEGDSELKNWILSEYETYLEQEKLEEKSDEEKSQKEEFIESLDGNISLQEQHDFAINAIEKSNDKDKDSADRLPDDVII